MYICYCPLRDLNWNKNIVLYTVYMPLLRISPGASGILTPLPGQLLDSPEFPNFQGKYNLKQTIFKIYSQGQEKPLHETTQTTFFPFSTYIQICVISCNNCYRPLWPVSAGINFSPKWYIQYNTIYFIPIKVPQGAITNIHS